jgi:hypothetical protein
MSDGRNVSSSPPTFAGALVPKGWTHIKYWRDETSGIALVLKTAVPSCHVEDEASQYW